MFSEKIYLDIAGLTQKVLEEMRSTKAIDQVTVVRGYAQLSARNVSGYDAKLMAGIERLLELARLGKRQQLSDALAVLVHAMDQEFTA